MDHESNNREKKRKKGMEAEKCQMMSFAVFKRKFVYYISFFVCVWVDDSSANASTNKPNRIKGV